MFQKSLQILIASALLALAAIVGYSALRLHGPEDTLAEARSNFAEGRYGEVIDDLSLAEHGASFRSSIALMKELWQIRYEAYASLDNPKGALDDVQRLLAAGVEADDAREALRLDEIRLLAGAGEGERARRRGLAFLEEAPRHGRALELTGEACQTIYQPKLRELQVRLERDLGQIRRAQARKALLCFLYAPAGARAIERSLTLLEEMFQTEPRLVAVWPEVQDEARALRLQIQEGLGFFQRSLDAGGEPVAAFRAVATAFEQSGHIDDLLMACEIQRRVFDHAYVAESGVWSAWVQLEHGLPDGAIAAVDRWIKPEDVEPRAAAGTLSPSAEQLALARALGTWQLGVVEQIWKTYQLVTPMRENGLPALAALWLTNAARLTYTDQRDAEALENNIAYLLRGPLASPPPLDRPDLVSVMEPRLLDNLLERNAPETETLETLAAWRSGRPESVEPRVRTALYLQSLGRTAAALSAIADAVEVAPNDARLLPLRVKISAEHYEATSQSGASLLAQCAQARKTVPDTEDPIGYLLCGEAALDTDTAGSRLVALNCARAAIGAFPHANLPRQLELRALIKLGRAAEAAKAAEQIIRTIVPDAETLRLAITATRAAGEPLRSLARLAMPRVTSSHELQAELLRIALEDAPATAVQFLTDDMTAPDADVADRTLAVRALSACGQIDAAHAQLMATSPQREEESRELVLGAFSAWLVARSTECDDATLRPEANALNDHLHLAVGPQAPLLETIPALAATHPLTAFELLELSLAAAAPSERTGALFLLAGELALTAGDYTRAEARWTAALGFTGADAVAERLTRLLVLQGDLTRAARVYRLVDSVDDAALASLMGRPADAAAALARHLQQDPADLLAHATLAIFGQPAMVDWAAPTDPALMTARLELISGLHEPRLSALTLPRAEALLRADPSKNTHRLLVARASADAGLGADAATQHRGLFARGERTPVLLREVAYASAAAGYESTPAIDARITAGITEGTLGGSPLTVAYAADRIVSIFEAGGFAEQANAARLSQWLATPTARPWEPADLQLITTGHRPAEACYILDQILRGPHARDAAPLLEAFYELAPASITATPKSLATLRAMALGHLRRVGPRAAIVRFLLEHGADNADLNVTDMLLGHLRRIAAGDDDRSCLDLAVERLTERLGQPETATRVDALLDEFPTSIALWSLRSRIGEQLTDGLEILDGMRRVLSHADDPQAELAFFAVAAKNHGLTAEDAARLAALPAALRESGDGRYVDALFSLRFGDPSTAAATLATAAPQPDGAHLYFGAMAELMRADGAPDGRAKALLEQLQRDYPKSSLARQAGSFIRQLSPR